MPHNITTAAGKQGKSLVTHTKLLTECRRVLDKLTVALRVKKVPAFSGTQTLILVVAEKKIICEFLRGS